MKNSYILTFFFLMLFSCLQAQVNKDSLWTIWNTATLPDSARLSAIQALTFSIINSQPDSARMLAELQLDLATEKNLPRWKARALNSIGLSYRFQSDFAKAIQHYERSIALLEKVGDRNYMSAVYGNLGDVYRLQSNFPKAILAITKCLELAEETGDKKKEADAYISIATIYYENPDTDNKTLEYLNKALEIYQSLDNQDGLALAYGNLSAVYLDNDELDKALEYVDKTMTLQEKMNNQHGLATSLHNRATILGLKGKYTDALSDFKREIEIFQKMGDQEGLADAYNSMGDLWIQQKRYPAAIEVCNQALVIARKIGSPNLKEMEACDCLYQVYQKQGNFRQALQYLEQFVAVKDSLQQNETTQKLRQMEIQRQTAIQSLWQEKEKFRMEMSHQQAIRSKNKMLGWLLAGTLAVLTIALGFWLRMVYFRRRSKMLQKRSDELEKQQLLNEVALLRTQVNPHFLFNSLSILSSLVHVDANLSEQFIDQLSRSYRYILEQKEQSLVSLRTELEFIKAYSFLLKIRFENKFDLEVNLPEEILDTYKIAPLTLQLLIENAVKHNRMSVKEPLIVTVTLENGHTLLVKNRLQPRATAVVGTGTGLQNILNRYALLTDVPVWAGETQNQFIVKVPLLK